MKLKAVKPCSFIDKMKGRAIFMARRGTYKPAATEEERIKRNEYLKAYRAKNPDKARRWYENYVIKRVAQLQAAQNNGQQQAGPMDE